MRVSSIKWRQKAGKIHAEGVFFLPGRNANKQGHARYYLVLEGKTECQSFPLVAQKRPDQVRRHVDRGDIGNYDFGYFSTPDSEGIDISNVPSGRYRLLISMSAGGALFTRKVTKLTLK